MAPWLLPIASSLLQAQQNSEDERQARRSAQADISAQRARELGFPAYGIGAAQTNSKLEEDYGRKNFLAGLIPLLMSKGG